MSQFMLARRNKESACRGFTIGWLMLLFALVVPVQVSIAAGGADQPFRVGFTSSMFTDVNEGDARAAIKVWASVLARENGIPMEDETWVVSIAEAADMFGDGTLDGLGVMTSEYIQTLSVQSFDPIFTISVAGAKTESYLLLVHRDGPVRNLSSLRDKRMLVDGNARAALAPMWLDVILADAGLPVAERLTRSVSIDHRLGQVVLPVFFRQADACLVTRGGFETMVELNPQLREQLVVLAESEEIIPNMFVLRADYAPRFRRELLNALGELHRTPAGRQVLTIFRADKLETIAAPELDSARQLVRRYEALSR